MKLAIFQKEIPPYRVPFFDALGRIPELQITIFIAEKLNSVEIKYCEVIPLKKTQFKKFIYLRNVPSLVIYDCIIFPFDLGWMQLYSNLLLHRGKTVLWGHGIGKNTKLAFLRGKLINRSKGFIGYEKASNDFFLNYSVPASKLRYVGNTVAVENAEYSNKNRNYFLYLGRIQHRKNIDDVLLAMEDLTKGKKNIQLVIVGDGDYKKKLQNLVYKKGLENNVTFYPGTYSQAETKAYFSSAIAYVSPGHVGLGVLHSFAFGVPVITYDKTGHAPEVENIMSGINGDIIEANTKSLAQTLNKYLSEPEATKAKGKAAFEWYINNRTIENMANNFYNAVKDFIL